MSWWKKLIEAVKKWWEKEKPKPDPEPTPEPQPTKGYKIRLKTYDPPHKGRLFSAKIDTRFHTEHGMNNSNAVVTVDDVRLEYYGIDAENGKHDLCFTDKRRNHKDLPKPVAMRIYKDDKLMAALSIPEWKYGAVYVEATADTPEPQPDPDGATDRIKLDSWDAGAIRFSGTPRTWPVQNGDLSGEAILEIFRDGRWQGGKFEHCRNHMTHRGWENIKNHNPAHNQPYGVFKTLRPSTGEKARFRLISYNEKYFTNWLESTWK